MSLIVILDDRLTNRNIFARLAASIESDIHVQTFGDPLEALDWCSRHTPDLVITDYKMPHMDGAEFIAAFRRIPGYVDIPIVVITVYEDRTFRVRAFEAGTTDFIQSPVDHQEFVMRARNLLNLRKHQLLLAQRANSLERELKISEESRQQVLRDSKEQLAQVIDTLPIMIGANGIDGNPLFMNAYQIAFLGLSPEGDLQAQMRDVMGEEASQRNLALDRAVFETGRALPSYEEDIMSASQRKYVFLTTKSPLYNADGELTGVLTSSLDITARKRTEAHLSHLAHHDALTDLPNRVLLQDRIRSHISLAKRGQKSFAIHILDLDGFKRVNDLLGHGVGDSYIQAVANRLRTTIRESDTLARLGGDEFAILQANVTHPEDAKFFANRILKAVEGGDFLIDPLIQTTSSIGIALYPADGLNGEELLKNADLAMYKAKAESGNHFCFYEADMNVRARQDAILDAGLKEALEQNQFEVFFQPQVSLASNQIVGAEALLRWRHPKQGLIGPSAFLARAEANGMIVPMSEWILLQSCLEACRWQALGLPRLRVGVNISPVLFRKRAVPQLIEQILHQTGLDPSLLELELTESIVMHDYETVANDLKVLSDLGVSLAIDDFGTGYSSLGYIKKFPVHRLKIDQSFVRSLTTNANDVAIIRAIINLGHSLDMRLIAEGVENADQLVRLQAEGCDEVQGYYFGKPMPSADFIHLSRSDAKMGRG